MKKIVTAVIAVVLAAGLSSAMTPKEIDTFLRNHAETGYRFIRSSGETTWYVAFRLPDWTTEWSVAVVLVSDDSAGEFLVVGSTVARTSSPPSPALMKFLLEKNNEDTSLGTFSLYLEKEHTVQYTVRVPNRFLSPEALLYYIGFVAGYCNKVAPEVANFLAASRAPALEPATGLCYTGAKMERRKAPSEKPFWPLRTAPSSRA